MVDREQLETLLANRFSGATREQIAAAANAIMAMVRTAGNPAVDCESPGVPRPPSSVAPKKGCREIRSDSRMLL
jgi:hypothetical protein